MTTQQARGLKTETLTDDAVVQYLQTYPDFFERHSSLLTRLRLPHLRNTGQTVSLVERQVDVLRERNQGLERKLNELSADAAAFYDATTTVSTYKLLRERARQLLALARRHELTAALLHVDLKRLSAINAAHGRGRISVCGGACAGRLHQFCCSVGPLARSLGVGVKKTGKGRRKLGRKKRRMRSKIRHRKG